MKLALGHFIQFPSPTPLHVLNNLNNIRMMLFMGFGFTSVYIALLCCKALTKLGIEFDISFDTAMQDHPSKLSLITLKAQKKPQRSFEWVEFYIVNPKIMIPCFWTWA